jgi:uncharacterized protein (DUF302 family)
MAPVTNRGFFLWPVPASGRCDGRADKGDVMKTIFMLLMLTVMTALPFRIEAAVPVVAVHSVKGKFDEIKERVVMAIENRGMVLNYTAHVGEMLERTGKDLGRTRQIYTQAESLEFCSASLSRETMEADAHNIAFCPYSIAVYVLTKEPDKVYVSYRRLVRSGTGRSAKALGAVEKLLADIVGEALK